ncbi:hypothetical protein [Yersinia phage fHe-Yen9-03]|uniref:Uncharacterized protein n=1 Tax=Yersinia phage fHe-Yen9-03 TaxID=2052743 RepID=A0A2C9CZA5_9CAUD|nr:hypothetical protein [Yersinia phage fHe-Yen9-03]
MEDINSTIVKNTKIVRTFEQISFDDIKTYLPHLNVVSGTKESMTGSTKLFSIFFSDSESVLVSRDVIMYIFDKTFVKFNTNITEEQMFQDSTRVNYGNLAPETLPYLRELIQLLDHLWK